jgi:hypothetical protein
MEDMRLITGVEKKGGGCVFVNKKMLRIWMAGVKQISRFSFDKAPRHAAGLHNWVEVIQEIQRYTFVFAIHSQFLL